MNGKGSLSLREGVQQREGEDRDERSQEEIHIPRNNHYFRLETVGRESFERNWLGRLNRRVVVVREN